MLKEGWKSWISSFPKSILHLYIFVHVSKILWLYFLTCDKFWQGIFNSIFVKVASFDNFKCNLLRTGQSSRKDDLIFDNLCYLKVQWRALNKLCLVFYSLIFWFWIFNKRTLNLFRALGWKYVQNLNQYNHCPKLCESYSNFESYGSSLLGSN
jgi:hypothetical protein